MRLAGNGLPDTDIARRRLLSEAAVKHM